MNLLAVFASIYMQQVVSEEAVPLSRSWSSWGGSGYIALAGMHPRWPASGSCSSVDMMVYAVWSSSESDNAHQGLMKGEGGEKVRNEENERSSLGSICV